LCPISFLHAPNVGTAHHQPRTERVPKVVPPEVADAGAAQGGLEHSVVEVLGVAAN
jgi:hypothetical protein